MDIHDTVIVDRSAGVATVRLPSGATHAIAEDDIDALIAALQSLRDQPEDDEPRDLYDVI